MYLKRITVTGFKSFANKTVIELERGITGVVGPNGSGKSNIADAIRWALGEQRGSRLRLEGRDEVVFAGTEKRAKASFAEVILLFDNESGAFPIDLTEVEIARRMYRSGETDYRLAGRSVRLSDIQALLAQAGVGASTYAVIGQGMIDSLLMSSPAERKLLFEDAAGIRGPELGREAAVRKLAATAANLTRLRDIAAELAPRLGSLETAVGAADERERLAAEVTRLRQAATAAEQAHWHAAARAAEDQLAELADRVHRLRHELHHHEQALARLEAAEARAFERRQSFQSGLAELEQRRDQAAAAVADCRAQVVAATRDAEAADELAGRIQAADAELEGAQGRLRELRAELASNAEAAARAAKAVDRAARDVATAGAALVAIRDGTGDSARDQYLDNALNILKALAKGLGTPEFTDSQIRLLVHKAGRLLSHATRSGAAELLVALKTAQKHLEAAMAKRETAIEHQTNVSITARSLEIDVAHVEAELGRLTSARAALATDHAQLRRAGAAQSQLQAALAEAEARLAEITGSLDDGRANLASLGAGAGTPGRQAEAATGRERAQMALATALRERVAAHQVQAEAAAGLRASAARAKAWGITLPTVPAAAPRPGALAELADQLARAETMLEARTEMYEQQLGEYQEVSERHTELVAQIADLEAAEADLGRLISELDTLIRARFKQNFQALAEQFGNYFARLFEGGTASLELTEVAETPGRDGSGYGINIKASPKGKRLASIAALSGGERALAGVALVAAIMRVNPSPFVVLDEIDAALDEANSGRLAGILTELQEYSQLIVITHNRQTMNAAKVLFGVTINEHHISHLISLRLEQAAQLAAR